MTNILWLPDDCHVIEFNEFPDDNHYTESHGGEPVRNVVMTGFWGRTGTGEFWIVPASVKNRVNFYNANLRVSIRDILLSLQQMDGGKLLNTSAIDWTKHPHEEPGFWTPSDIDRNPQEQHIQQHVQRMEDLKRKGFVV
jgi:hypothetical protein